MGKILSALKIGDLMMENDLTWQAVVIFVILIAAGIAWVTILFAKAVKAWRDALR